VHDNGDILKVRTQLSAILAVCLFILVKIFLISQKTFWFELGGFLLMRNGFRKAARVVYPADFDNKNSLFTSYHRCSAF
jgi:hypothetical protein